MKLRGCHAIRGVGLYLLGMLFVSGALAVGLPAGDVHPGNDALERSIISKLVEQNQLREQRLQEYTVDRYYQLRSSNGETRAEATVQLQYRAPDTKEFKTLSQNGSMVGSMVFRQMQEGEAEGMKRHMDLTPANYDFDLVGEDVVNGQRCYVLAVKPKRQDRLLFEGRVWVNANEFAVMKIAGRPVHNPSWWIKSSSFVRYYDKIGDFWLPVKDETTTQVRIFGANFLTVQYSNYQVVPTTEASTTPLPDPPAHRSTTSARADARSKSSPQ